MQGEWIKGKIVAGLMCAVCFLAGYAYAENQYYLPHFANGSTGAGGYKTTFVLCNNAKTEATATVNVSDDSGNSLPVKIGGTSAGRFTVQLSPGATQMLETDGRGSLVSGAAKVTSTSAIGVSAIFTISDAAGNYLAQTGVGAAEPLSSFVLPVDTTGLFNTALALLNTTDGSINVTLTLRNTSGQQVGTPVVLKMAAYSHVARYISGSGQLFPSASNVQGTVLVQSTGPVAAAVLRQNTMPLSYTSLSGVSTASTAKKLYIPQVANGGGYRTSVLIYNVSANSADLNLAFTDEKGNPLTVTIFGVGEKSTFSFLNLASGASLFLQTDGAGDLATGAATITSDTPIGASGIYATLDSAGNLQRETGVPCSSAFTSLTMPVEVTGDSNTGVAFMGTSGASAVLTIRFLDDKGTTVGSSVTRTLAANGQFADLVSELFPAISNLKGSLSVKSTGGIAALPLHIVYSPLLFTSLPVIQGAVFSEGEASFTMEDTISDQAQRTTLAFSGLAMMTGNLEAQSFFPPGKVADYTGFQYLRDNDPDNMGHNTSFLTRVANNVIYILNDSQFNQLKTLAVAQLDQINLYGYNRFPLMKAFRRLFENDIPSGSTGLNLNAVKKASRELYLIDGQTSFDRAVLYANIIKSLDSTQKAYLDAMKGKGWSSWPDITDTQINSRMRGLPQGTSVAVMTYAGDLFSWYAGSVEADVYFCPERQGTYYGSFYIKDAPAIGHEGYGIDEQLTATAGEALSNSSKGYVTSEQAATISGLVDLQRNNLYASDSSNIVTVRTQIATLLRSLLTTSGSTDSIKSQVLALSGTYGDLDGKNNYYYATVFAQVYKTLSGSQKNSISALRKSIMSGTYSDGTPFDFSICTTPFLYSSAITDTSVLAPYVSNTNYLFFEP